MTLTFCSTRVGSFRQCTWNHRGANPAASRHFIADRLPVNPNEHAGGKGEYLGVFLILIVNSPVSASP
jgi:hypothetical protein